MKISVIIPTYNRAELLRKTLDSVLSQTKPADEVIVVDDGSTDETRQAVARYRHPVMYHYQKNAHLGAARNTGQRLATGEALLFLDSDDLLTPHALERLTEALQARPDVALAYCACRFIDAEGNPSDAPFAHPFFEGDVWERLVAGNFIRSAGSVLIRSSSLEKIGPWVTREQLRSNEDWEMWLRLSETGPFVHLPEPLFLYRVHASMSSDETAMYHWAFTVLEMQIARHADHPNRLSVLAKAYDTFHEATAFRWKQAMRNDWVAGKWKSAFRRALYLLRLRSRHRHNLRVLSPHRNVVVPTVVEP
ncbi:MAG: glycosyltransferase [Fibrella sp.]|nr:glycosyltransferase [Armatimonadota bacterium]